MKKTLLTVVAMMATCSAVMAQNGIVEVPDAEGHGFMATTMSPNGKYIAGADALHRVDSCSTARASKL